MTRLEFDLDDDEPVYADCRPPIEGRSLEEMKELGFIVFTDEEDMRRQYLERGLVKEPWGSK